MAADVVERAEHVLWRARGYMLDALCIHVWHSQITVSVPLLLGIDWDTAPDPSKVAHALFVTWLATVEDCTC